MRGGVRCFSDFFSIYWRSVTSPDYDLPSPSIARTLAYTLLFWATGASAQVVDTSGAFTGPPVTSDSLLTGTALPDSATLADSLGKKRVPALIGSFDRTLDSSFVITARGMQRMDFRYAGDLLSSLPGTFPLDQASEGQYSTMRFGGVDWRGLSLALDGRGVNDPASGISNLYWAALDYVERIEVVTGTRSFLYGLNAAGAAVNFVTRNYNSNRPLSAITYSEAGSGYTLADGTYSQNITRRFNLTAGFQARNTEGRYSNSLSESWNGRLKLRYHLTDNLLLFLSEYFTSSYTELNGGVNFDASGSVRSFVPVQATMINTDAYEKVTRHELAMTLAGTLLGDTANVTSLSFSYSHNLREYRDEENRPDPNGVLIQSDHVSSWMGALLRQNITTSGQSFELGANLEIRQIEGSPNLGRRRNVIGAVWGKEEIRLWQALSLAGYRALRPLPQRGLCRIRRRCTPATDRNPHRLRRGIAVSPASDIPGAVLDGLHRRTNGNPRSGETPSDRSRRRPSPLRYRCGAGEVLATDHRRSHHDRSP